MGPLILSLTITVIVIVSIPLIKRKIALDGWNFLLKPALVIFVVALIYLVLTGRLHVLFALLGLLPALIRRVLPWAIKAWPYAKAAHTHYRKQKTPPPTRGTKITGEAEALAILGLKPGATTKEIEQAYKRLMSKLHPDKGGNDYLAQQLNQARDYLLNRKA